MTDAITKFNIQMTDTLKSAQNRLEVLNAKAKAGAEHADKEIRKQIAALEEQAHKAKVSIESAYADMKKSVAEPMSAVTEWKAKFDVSRLDGRAERAEHYAKAASEVAIASVAAAEKAALDARLARTEAVAAKSAKAA
jgi:stress response protein YsnF